MDEQLHSLQMLAQNVHGPCHENLPSWNLASTSSGLMKLSLKWRSFKFWQNSWHRIGRMQYET